MFAVALFAAILLFHATDLPPGAALRLGDNRFRAGGELRHLQFSADGQTLHGWVAGRNGSLRPIAWDAITGIPLLLRDNPAPPNLPGNAIPAVRLHGNRVLTAGPGRVARVWDADSRNEVCELHGHTTPISAVAASADGKHFATGSTDGLVRVWDAETYLPLPGPRGHTGAVRSARVSADGTRAVTNGDDGAARVWDLKTGRQLRAFASNGPVEIDAGGTSVVVPAGGTVVTRDVLTGLEVVPASLRLRASPTLSDWLTRAGFPLSISSNGRVVAGPCADVTITIRESATGEVRRTLAGHRGGVRVLAFTPDGTRLLTAGDDHTILVWDVRLQALPLTEAIKKETSATKLWTTMTTGKADAAYLAMARFAVEPPASVKMARMRLKPARWSEEETVATRLADSRAVELLESLGTPEAKDFLKELAAGAESAWRTREAKRAVERLKTSGYNGRQK